MKTLNIEYIVEKEIKDYIEKSNALSSSNFNFEKAFFPATGIEIGFEIKGDFTAKDLVRLGMLDERNKNDKNQLKRDLENNN